MLLVVLGTPRPGTMQERLKRRMEWSYPEGSGIVAEYWLQSPDPSLITITETDDLARVMAATAVWDDVFEFRVVPAVTAEQGLEMAKKMMA